jgi:sulfatase modifying factor 1
MQRAFSLLGLVRAMTALLLLLAVPSFAQAITIDTVPIGNPGNADDAKFQPANQPFGGVPYAYRIGTYEVTVGQYAAFLNAVAKTDKWQLFPVGGTPPDNPDFTFSADLGGPTIGDDRVTLVRLGQAGNYSYTVFGNANYPMTQVSVRSAQRFANWLSNGQPTGAQDLSTTEAGSYTMLGNSFAMVPRNSGATWVIPSMDEWYKAAFYDPSAEHYWFNAAGAAGFHLSFNKYHPTDGTHTASYDGSSAGTTQVGHYPNTRSAYGTFDQAGNVGEFADDAFDATLGGSFVLQPSPNAGNVENFGYVFGNYVGFRVAFIPEPSSFVLAMLGFIGFVAWGWRRR